MRRIRPRLRFTSGRHRGAAQVTLSAYTIAIPRRSPGFSRPVDRAGNRRSAPAFETTTLNTPHLSAPRVAGALLGLIGLIGLTLAWCWMFEADFVARLAPGSLHLGVISPLLTACAAVCFFGVSPAPKAGGWLDRITALCAGVLIALPLAHLFEHATGLALGLDIAPPGALATAANPHPGRISPNAGLAFLCAGAAFWLLHRAATPGRRRAYLGLVLMVSLIGLAGLAGHLLGLETLYQIAGFNRMRPVTALIITVLGAGLWLVHQEREAATGLSAHQYEKRIKRRSLAVLTIVTIGGGVAGFAVMRDTFEQSLSRNLLLTATTSATSLAGTLEARLRLSNSLAARPAVREALERLDRAPDDDDARQALRELLANAIDSGLSGAEFRGAHGASVAGGGVLLRAQAQAVGRLENTGHAAFLVWRDGYLLATEHELRDGDRSVGHLVTEQRLPAFDSVLADLRAASEGSDVAICSRDGDRANCAPTKFRPQAFTVPLFDAAGEPSLPVVQALLGERGVRFARDRRGVDVLSAFTPIRNYGLALGMKTDIGTLHAPLRSRLNLLVLALIGLVALGSYAQRSQVRPVIRQVLAEQRRNHVILENSNDAFIALAPDGRITDWNSEACRTFGWTAAEALGRHLAELIIPAAQRAAHDAGFRRFMASGTGPVINTRLELTALHKDGREFPIELSVASLPTDTGFAATAFVRDITLRNAAQAKLAASERRLKAITDNIPALIAHIDMNERYLLVNERIEQTFERPAHELVGKTMAELFEPALYETLAPHIRQVLAGHFVTFEGQTTVRGRERHFQATYMPDIDELGVQNGFYSMTFDITERRMSELKQAANELRLRMITDNVPVLISYIDAERRVTYCNATFKEWTGVDPTPYLGQRLADVIGAAEYEARRPYLDRALAGERVQFEVASDVMKNSRHLEVTYVPDNGPDGKVIGVYTVSTDVSALKRTQQELTMLAQFDPLTGLPNRRQLDQRLAEALRRNQRSQSSMALLFLDIDKFKEINDTLGHAAGDDVLVEFGRRLQASVRKTDTVARLAGDEFVVVVEALHGIGESELVARKILDTVAKPWAIADGALAVSTSIGVAYAAAGASAPELLSLADKALYQAKAEGRNTFCVRSA